MENSMLKKSLLGLSAAIFLFVSCSKDEEMASATDLDKIDWYRVENLPGEYNQVRYSIYEKSGITILVNDTLGRAVIGVDNFGKPIVHTEVFDIGYNVMNERFSDFRVDHSSDTTAMIKAMSVIEKYVLPNLSKKTELRPRVIYLMDTIYYQTATKPNIVGDYYCYRKCIAGVPIGHIEVLKDVDSDRDEWRYWAASILAVKAANWTSSICKDEYNEFIELTPNQSSGQSYYYYTGNAGLIDCRTASFLKWGIKSHDLTYMPQRWTETAPDKVSDLQEYIVASFLYKGHEDEFRGKYNNYKPILDKFDVVQRMLEKYYRFSGVNVKL